MHEKSIIAGLSITHAWGYSDLLSLVRLARTSSVTRRLPMFSMVGNMVRRHVVPTPGPEPDKKAIHQGFGFRVRV